MLKQSFSNGVMIYFVFFERTHWLGICKFYFNLIKTFLAQLLFNIYLSYLFAIHMYITLYQYKSFYEETKAELN